MFSVPAWQRSSRLTLTSANPLDSSGPLLSFQHQLIRAWFQCSSGCPLCKPDHLSWLAPIWTPARLGGLQSYICITAVRTSIRNKRFPIQRGEITSVGLNNWILGTKVRHGNNGEHQSNWSVLKPISNPGTWHKRENPGLCLDCSRQAPGMVGMRNHAWNWPNTL